MLTWAVLSQALLSWVVSARQAIHESGCVELGCVESGCAELGCVELGCVESSCDSR